VKHDDAANTVQGEFSKQHMSRSSFASYCYFTLILKNLNHTMLHRYGRTTKYRYIKLAHLRINPAADLNFVSMSITVCEEAVLGSYMSHRGACSIGKDRMEKKMILRGIRITHLLLSWRSSYPVRLEGHLNLNLVLECITIKVNTEVFLTMLVKILAEERSNFSPLFFNTPFSKGERTDFCTSLYFLVLLCFLSQ
jgi:hypothetical protein